KDLRSLGKIAEVVVGEPQHLTRLPKPLLSIARMAHRDPILPPLDDPTKLIGAEQTPRKGDHPSHRGTVMAGQKQQLPLHHIIARKNDLLGHPHDREHRSPAIERASRLKLCTALTRDL